jgi:CubicO group peptidase (beta-lactamase class C family)
MTWRIALAGALVALFAGPLPARAGGQIGKRFFPSTLAVDDPFAADEPALAGTEYGRTSLRDLLQMSSGVRFVEEYSGRDDVSMLAADTFMLIGAGGAGAVRPFNTRAVPAGTKFSYASVETQVLGLVLRRAVGTPVADYLHDKLWAPMGRKPTRRGSSTARARRRPSAVSARCCATTRGSAFSSRTVGSGVADR